MNDAAITVADLRKSYHLGRTTLKVLRKVSFEVAGGQFAAIVGTSGSGKSTLLHLVGLLDRPDDGRILLDGVDVASLSAAARNRIRCNDVGFVFQFYHLLPELNVLENVLLPAKVDASAVEWVSRRSAMRDRAAGTLQAVGLAERLRHRPKELSGGERQRVAIARALMNRPKILLVDEPTGNLDSKTGKQIMNVLKDCNRQRGQTILMVTHDTSLAGEADRILELRDGRLFA